MGLIVSVNAMFLTKESEEEELEVQEDGIEE
jgi:hypothetical protein